MLKFGSISKLLNGGTFKFTTSFEISAHVEGHKGPEKISADCSNDLSDRPNYPSGTIGVIPAKDTAGYGIHCNGPTGNLFPQTRKFEWVDASI